MKWATSACEILMPLTRYLSIAILQDPVSGPSVNLGSRMIVQLIVLAFMILSISHRSAYILRSIVWRTYLVNSLSRKEYVGLTSRPRLRRKKHTLFQSFPWHQSGFYYPGNTVFFFSEFFPMAQMTTFLPYRY
jgi:hypothetical protein